MHELSVLRRQRDDLRTELVDARHPARVAGPTVGQTSPPKKAVMLKGGAPSPGGSGAPYQGGLSVHDHSSELFGKLGPLPKPLAPISIQYAIKANFPKTAIPAWMMSQSAVPPPPQAHCGANLRDL